MTTFLLPIRRQAPEAASGRRASPPPALFSATIISYPCRRRGDGDGDGDGEIILRTSDIDPPWQRRRDTYQARRR